MEELILTEPVVEPEKVTNKYHVVSLLMDMTPVPPGMPSETGLIVIKLRDNLDQFTEYRYMGAPAEQMIKSLNTANCSTKSMHKRILEKLSNDGLLPGTVTGTPDPIPPALDAE